MYKKKYKIIFPYKPFDFFFIENWHSQTECSTNIQWNRLITHVLRFSFRKTKLENETFIKNSQVFFFVKKHMQIIEYIENRN